MSWMAVGMMAVSTVSSLIGGSKAAGAQNVQNLNQQRQSDLNAVSQYDANYADNAAIADANLENVIRTGYKVGLLNIQRAQAKKQAMQQGIDLSRKGLQLTATATANAAASGGIGSSVQAVVLDIAQRQDEAGAQMGADYAQQEANFDVQLHDILLGGEDSMNSTKNISVQATQKASLISGSEIVTNALIGGATKGAQSYLSGQMNLGTTTSKTYAISNRGDSISPLTASDLGSMPTTTGNLFD